MTLAIKPLRQIFRRSNNSHETTQTVAPARPQRSTVRSLEIAPNDPLVAYFLSNSSPVEPSTLNLDSPALRELKQADVKLAVPLVSQGELIGLLNLGPRLSEQEYSHDDRGLLSNLATQAAPALRVAQLVRQRQAEVLELERVEQELRVARLIQQTLLPKEIPNVPGWELNVHYQPARAVGGDFYDFFVRPDGRIVLVVGDVTDKGVPAALVMATLRAILRGSMRRMLNPGAALHRSNNLLCPEIPPNMFVTCLFAILDPQTGKVQYANAGHELPIRHSNGVVTEFHARGMPLGLMPGMEYEEKEDYLAPGDQLLLYSDGLVEAHDPARHMYGFERLRAAMATDHRDAEIIPFLLDSLKSFVGADWEQEDDVTLLTLSRCEMEDQTLAKPSLEDQESAFPISDGNVLKPLLDFALPSEPGNEYEAMKIVSDAMVELRLPPARLEQLKTAVAEATMNAMEHGNKFNPQIPVFIRVMSSEEKIIIDITDQGGGRPIPTPHIPDLQAKLAGLESPRGWGLFLIKNLVDEMHVTSDDQHHTIELVLYRKGEHHADETA